MFYVGQQGAFDAMVRSVLKELVSVYPHIRYTVVLERLPPKRDEFDTQDYSDTMLPEGIENVHPRFAISWRNKWMIKQSDYVVSYITHSWGGAAQFAGFARIFFLGIAKAVWNHRHSRWYSLTIKKGPW